MRVDDDCLHVAVTPTVIMSFDRMDISGKVALITGSSKRVGRETAVELARRGARVAIHYRSDEAGARETLRLVQEAGGAGELFHAELTDHLALDNMFSDLEQRMGSLHILVNNASVFDPGTLEQSTPDLWKLQMDANAMAPFFIAQRASRLMSRQQQAKIVNLVDVAGETIWPGYLVYSVSKAALIAVNRGLAKALAPNIQVNGIAPGPVLFPENYTEEQKRLAVERTLLKKAGSAKDIVNAVVFLIENDYITGEVLHVDGGRHIM
jgi:NAD(P)-dependent dehydrogenase (short-subunit alcohol dehydrogenase family)